MSKEVRIIEIFGKNVKKYMELNKFSINDLSQKTGISERYIRKIINGDATGAMMSHVLLMAAAFSIEPYLLLEEQ